MPGAELTETIDDRNWKGKLTMKFGPVSMSFAGSVTLRGARRGSAPRGPACEGHRAEGQGGRGRQGHLLARGRGRRDGGEDAGGYDAHRRGRTAVARAAPGGLEAPDAAVRGLPRTEHRARRPAPAKQAAASTPSAAPAAAKPIGGVRPRPRRRVERGRLLLPEALRRFDRRARDLGHRARGRDRLAVRWHEAAGGARRHAPRAPRHRRAPRRRRRRDRGRDGSRCGCRRGRPPRRGQRGPQHLVPGWAGDLARRGDPRARRAERGGGRPDGRPAGHRRNRRPAR